MYTLGSGVFNGWSEIEIQSYIDKYFADKSSVNLSWQEIIVPTYIWYIGQFVGSIFWGLITMKFGRKKPLLFISIPIIVSIYLYKLTSLAEMI